VYSVAAQETAKHCAVWLASSERRRCSNEGKAQNLLKFAGAPQTRQQISAVNGPKFAILSEHVDDILQFNKFFPSVDTCLSCKDISRQSCEMVPRWRYFASFLHPVFSAIQVQHISDIHSKFALKPHHVWKYGRHPISGLLRLGEDKKKTERKKDRNHRAKYNGLLYSIGRP